VLTSTLSTPSRTQKNVLTIADTNANNWTESHNQPA
jgi:hypothetical protein